MGVSMAEMLFWSWWLNNLSWNTRTCIFCKSIYHHGLVWNINISLLNISSLNGNFTPAGTLSCSKYRQKNSSPRLQVKVTRQKVPDVMQVLMVSSAEEPQWEEFSHRFEWQGKARERERQSLGNLQPRASWRTGEEMHRMSFFLFSHLRILSSPGALRSAEHPRSPALPSLVCENKNSRRSLSFPPSFSFFHARSKTTWGALLYKTLSEMNLLPVLSLTRF